MRTYVNEKSPPRDACRSAPAAARPPLAGEVGAGLGIIAGAAAGVVAGPIGMIVGASAGAVAGEAVGNALHRRAETRSKHDRELDKAISLTPGTVGVDAELVTGLQHGCLLRHACCSKHRASTPLLATCPRRTDR